MLIHLLNGTKVSVYEPRDFSELIDRNLGLDAKVYFDNLLQSVEEAKADMQQCRSDAEELLLRLVSVGKFVDDESRNAFAEEVSAIMEDVYGIE